MFDPGLPWGVATVLGPVLLFAVIMYGVLLYDPRSTRGKRHAEDAALALYREGTAAERDKSIEGDIASPPLAPGRVPH